MEIADVHIQNTRNMWSHTIYIIYNVHILYITYNLHKISRFEYGHQSQRMIYNTKNIQYIPKLFMYDWSVLVALYQLLSVKSWFMCCTKCDHTIQGCCIGAGIITYLTYNFSTPRNTYHITNRIPNSLDILCVNLWPRQMSCDSFDKHGLTLIPALVSNHIPSKGWDEIIHTFLNFNGANFGMNKKCHPILYNGCNYLCMLGLKLIHVSRMGSSS